MKFSLKSEYIELCVLLKLMNLVQSGGEAKHHISEGRVKLNGEAETRRKKKIFAGDVVEFEGVAVAVTAS